MAEQQYISVKVSGRPDSNAGFNPLIASFNNPQFVDSDPQYVGFRNNPYFFTIRLTRLCAIYKLVVNRVYSNDAARVGQLQISFSIPPGYKLDAEVSPYTVLKELFNAFAENYLSVRDANEHSYEFNGKKIPQSALNDVAKQFTLVPDNAPYRIMNGAGAIGYLTIPEEKIEELLNDVQYPEFEKFREVIVAENYSSELDAKSSDGSYKFVGEIEIPRPKPEPTEESAESIAEPTEPVTKPVKTVVKPAEPMDESSYDITQPGGATKPSQQAIATPVLDNRTAEEPQVITIVLRLNANRILSSNRRQRVEVRMPSPDGHYGVALSTDVMFSKPDLSGISEGRFYLPKTWEDYVPTIAFLTDISELITKKPVDLHDPVVTLYDSDFHVETKPFFVTYKKPLILAGALAAMFIFGLLTGLAIMKLSVN